MTGGPYLHLKVSPLIDMLIDIKIFAVYFDNHLIVAVIFMQKHVDFLLFPVLYYLKLNIVHEKVDLAFRVFASM